MNQTLPTATATIHATDILAAGPPVRIVGVNHPLGVIVRTAEIVTIGAAAEADHLILVDHTKGRPIDVGVAGTMTVIETVTVFAHGLDRMSQTTTTMTIAVAGALLQTGTEDQVPEAAALVDMTLSRPNALV